MTTAISVAANVNLYAAITFIVMMILVFVALIIRPRQLMSFIRALRRRR